jgi:hypothetical protein
MRKGRPDGHGQHLIFVRSTNESSPINKLSPSVALPSGDPQGARLKPLLQAITLQLDAGNAGVDLYRGLSSTDVEARSIWRLATIFSR